MLVATIRTMSPTKPNWPIPWAAQGAQPSGDSQMIDVAMLVDLFEARAVAIASGTGFGEISVTLRQRAPGAPQPSAEFESTESLRLTMSQHVQELDLGIAH